MSTHAVSLTSASRRRSLTQMDARTRRRKRRSAVMTGVLTATMVLAALPLFLIVAVVVGKGWSVIDLHFFTQDTLPFRLEGGGFRQGFVGSLLIMALAIPMAVGPGIAAAVYLVEYGRGKKLAALVRFVTDVMTGVPSIFVGLFVYTVLVIGTLKIGFGTLAAAVAIAIVMLPIIVRSSEEMLKLVPDSLRNAALGMGARRVAGDHQGGPAGRRARPRHGVDARGGPRRRRDRTADPHRPGFVHDGVGVGGRAAGVTAAADPPKRSPTVRSRHRPRLGRRAVPARHHAAVHGRCPCDRSPLR